MIISLILLSVISSELTSTALLVSGQVVVALISGYCLVKVSQLKSHINSRMDELLKLTSEAGFAKGKIEGKQDQKDQQAKDDQNKKSQKPKKSY